MENGATGLHVCALEHMQESILLSKNPAGSPKHLELVPMLC